MRQLATTGPYAYTRNPLYLGSVLMALGFVIAARNWWIGLAALAMFLIIYIPVIKAEEVYLRGIFSDYSAICSECAAAGASTDSVSGNAAGMIPTEGWGVSPANSI